MAGIKRGAVRGRICAALALALALGCSKWREVPKPPSALPAARMSPDTVVLEVFTIEMPGEFRSQWETVWTQLDEQHLPAELRVRLSANGIRCGRCGLQLPLAACSLFDRVLTASREANDFGETAPGTLVVRRIHSRAGRRGRIPLSGPHPELSILWNEVGQVRGEAYSRATCVIAVRTFPLGDGRVRVELTPEIEHGPPQQRLVDGEGALRWEASQDRRVYDDLCMESILAPGQTLFLSATPQMAGLGRAYFGRDADDGPHPVLLVLRLAQTQHDDRFAPERIVTPLVTPSE